MPSWNEQVIAEFRANHGAVGGAFEGATLLLLHTTGARTGQERVSPVAYNKVGEQYLVFASFAGRDENPAWYHNLLAHPDVTIEVGDDVLAVTASVVEGAERDRQYAAQVERMPGFGDYERRTTRVIPVVALTPRAA